MPVWIEECFVRAADPANFISYARCYEYLKCNNIPIATSC